MISTHYDYGDVPLIVVPGNDGNVIARGSPWRADDRGDRFPADAKPGRLHQQAPHLYEGVEADAHFDELIGRSAALEAVLEEVRRVAPTDASVLIHGETGTGKELIARAVHSASRRRNKPLVKINCGAMPAGLVESELFGHERGAFTGAVARHVGRFEVADGGTIFLDEVGELPPEAQVKLLRFLQERTVDRVGGTTPIHLDLRVLAATNRDLCSAVAEKTFREDLYYRLNVFPIALPPLRERKEDIPLLVHFLIDKFAARIGKRIDGITRQSMQRLIDYRWPGNVRELENVLERAVILTAGATLEVNPDPSPAPPAPLAPAAPADGTTPDGTGSGAVPGHPPDLKTVERQHISAVLEQTDGVVEGPHGAALILGLHPNTLRHRMRKLGITRTSRRAPRGVPV